MSKDTERWNQAWHKTFGKWTRRCDQCNTIYEKGFFGTGYKYCSKLCREVKRNEYQKILYQRQRKKTSMDCHICGRDIGGVGISKNINKYCSTRCMDMGTRQRKGQKYCYVKIPITVQKSVKVLIKDLPYIIGGKK